MANPYRYKITIVGHHDETYDPMESTNMSLDIGGLVFHPDFDLLGVKEYWGGFKKMINPQRFKLHGDTMPMTLAQASTYDERIYQQLMALLRKRPYHTLTAWETDRASLWYTGDMDGWDTGEAEDWGVIDLLPLPIVVPQVQGQTDARKALRRLTLEIEAANLIS